MTPAALSLFIQNIPSTLRRLTLKVYDVDFSPEHPTEILVHCCAYIAPACRNLEYLFYTPRWVSFFTSAESFPNLRELHIALDCG
ncbi:hypothetical protein HK097_000364 [Rhizophlyctis rosea]|uniref:Uncharacterized protein n=1 Tax=Rhizophlyctis rosea TaxID=64517 RepID=A0AAD5S859_9FUNG|nr:hypothetical protein HK097_000364 [Rhizophlyctis rosea]